MPKSTYNRERVRWCSLLDGETAQRFVRPCIQAILRALTVRRRLYGRPFADTMGKRFSATATERIVDGRIVKCECGITWNQRHWGVWAQGRCDTIDPVSCFNCVTLINVSSMPEPTRATVEEETLLSTC